MIDRSHALPINAQAELVGISRGNVYYLPSAVSEADQRLMRRIDELNRAYPFAGSRMLRHMLAREGLAVGRRHVAKLMRCMVHSSAVPQAQHQQEAPWPQDLPYLLRGLTIDRANQVWATDITYIPMACGWVYLCAIVDWASRRVLAHRISISMDGRSAWRDNVFVERLWRSIKYEEVYLHAYDSVGQAKAAIGRYIDFYNSRRPHSSLDKETPDESYFATLRQLSAAA